MISQILEQLVNGLVLGAILTLVSIGLSLILGLLRVINFAHGAMFAIGAYTGFSIFSVTGNFLFAVIGALLAGIVCGLVIQMVFIQRIKEPEAGLILTFALLLAITEIIKVIWGPGFQLATVPKELFSRITIGPAVLSLYRILVAGVGVGILFGVWLFLKRTGAGLIARAVLDNKDMVESFGIRTSVVQIVIFVLASGIATLAGYLGGPIYGIFPDVGTSPLLFSFIAVVLGGIGNIWGTAIASIIIGIVIALTSLVMPALGYVAVYVIMIIAIFYRPQGLFTQSRD